MKLNRVMLNLMLVGCISISGTLIANAEEMSNNTSYAEELTSLIKKNPSEGNSTYASKRLIVKGMYESNNYGAVDVVHRGVDYTILQYNSTEDTEVAHHILMSKGCSVFIDGMVSLEQQAIPGYENHLDNGVYLLGLNSLQQNEDYNKDNIVKVAVLDSGIKESSQIYDRVIEQVDYTVSEGEQSIFDDKHGEDVSGIIVDSTSSNVQLISLKVISSDNGNISIVSLSAALAYAEAQGVDVVNMSFGIEGANKEELDFLSNSIDNLIKSGIPVIVASGNGEDQVAISTADTFPANYEPCWTVGSITDSKKISSFSNYDNVDFVAKGEAVSTLTCEEKEVCSGTSFSTPYISAFTATLKGNPSFKNLSVDELYEKIKSVCIDLGEEGFDKYYGWGMPSADLLSKDVEDFCKENGHSYSLEPTLVELPTCENNGKEVYSCTVCGHSDERVLESIGHSYKVTDCGVNTGTRVFTCANEGCTSSYEETGTFEHSWEKVENSETEATCTEHGYSTFKCSNCGISEIKETKEPLGHSWCDVGVKVSDATCTEKAVYQYSCTRCPVVQTKEEGEPLGHSITEGRRVEATCTKEGYIQGFCSSCGEEGTTQVLPINNHNHAGTASRVVTEATCTKDGSIDKVCNDCGGILESTRLTKTGHSKFTVTKDATCTEDGSISTKCSSCGILLSTEVIKAKGHVYQESSRVESTKTSDGVKLSTCIYCGDVKSEVLPKTGFVIGDVITKGNYKYKVIKAGEVSIIGSVKKKTDKKFKSISIGKTLSYKGFNFSITGIGNKAFKGYKYVTKISIGENITIIGKEAFYKCSKMKTLSIKSVKLKYVGSKAISGIRKDAIIKVPKSKLKVYKKLLKSKTGYKKSMKIKS